MSAERNKLIAIIDDDDESTTVAFFAKDEETVRRHAHSFYEAVFNLPNKGFGAPELADDVQFDDGGYCSSAVTIQYPKRLAREIIHDWLAENSIKFTEDGDDFYYA
jgi:hypothetical protein